SGAGPAASGRRALLQTTEDFVRDIKESADKLLAENVSRGDIKLLATAVRELRHCFKVFARYKDRRKATVFGSARTKPDHPTYLQAIEFGKRMTAEGWLTVTGAGAGIMEAAHVGAGRDDSMGLNILLPFEQSANPVMTGNDKLMTMRYFFTRKLMFVKETDAIVLFPGGFGTHDEAFESLTLIQTGKSHIFPVVLVDHPDGSYWSQWHAFVEQQLKANGLISPADTSLYCITHSVEEAVAEVVGFYRGYHSMRYVRKDLIVRLQKPISDALLDRLNADFKDIIWEGTIVRCGPDPAEANEPALAELPRLRFRFDRHGHARMRQMIDLINKAA
ncbi:MAG TPA: LOG family protein, partial [Gemmataceae bacterium]|nr:LOG family protein [Gemmataceae bacterium]